MGRPRVFLVSLVWVVMLALPAVAEDAAKPESGKNDIARQAAAAAFGPDIKPVDTLFLMGSATLALLMVPALGLFYGGMVRRKNVLAAFQQSFI
jgi:hypothetical protein